MDPETISNRKLHPVNFLPQDVVNAMVTCSLRFNGYKWLEARHPGRTTTFAPFVDPIVKTLRLHTDEEANFAACFALQRFLCKWGGEMLAPDSREHVAWRYLFLHLYARKTPSEFCDPAKQNEWERDHAPQAEAHAAVVRKRCCSMTRRSCVARIPLDGELGPFRFPLRIRLRRNNQEEWLSPV